MPFIYSFIHSFIHSFHLGRFFPFRHTVSRRVIHFLFLFILHSTVDATCLIRHSCSRPINAFCLFIHSLIYSFFIYESFHSSIQYGTSLPYYTSSLNGIAVVPDNPTTEKSFEILFALLDRMIFSVK